MDVRMIVLPRLHRELVTLPAGLGLPPAALFLWPGLPQQPDGFFCPEGVYPWSPAQAAACVQDFEAIARDGARGRPVQALAQNDLLGGDLLGSGKDLSPEERRALQEWRQAEDSRAHPEKPRSAPMTDLERRTAAQQVLLLAWLRESQNLELQELEAKVHAGRGLLSHLLGDGLGEVGLGDAGLGDVKHALSQSPTDATVEPGSALPAWRDVLEAALRFLPSDVSIVVTDRDMADAVLAQATGGATGPVDGWKAVPSRLGQDERTFFVPSEWVE